MIQEQDIPLIEDWLAGRLQGEALSAFENRLKNESEFADEVSIFAQAHTAAKDQASFQFRKKIDALIESEKFRDDAPTISGDNRKSFRFIWIGLFVLGLVLIIVLPGIFRNDSDASSSDSILDSLSLEPSLSPDTDNTDTLSQNLRLLSDSAVPTAHTGRQPDYLHLAQNNLFESEKVGTIRGDESTPLIKDTIAEAYQAYQDKLYTQALSLIRKLTAGDDQNIDALFLQGICYFRINEFGKAESDFNMALNSGKVAVDLAEWNILMCRLAQYSKRKKEFDQLMDKILRDKEHGFYGRAISLRKLMR